MSGSPQEDNLFRLLFNAVPLPLLRVTREIGILDLNAAAQKVYEASPGQALRKRGGDLLHCINAVGIPGGCGNVEPCAECRIRNSVQEVFDTGREISRLRIKAEIVRDTKAEALDLLLSMTAIKFAGESSVLLCLEDISELTSLRALLPICASCKKIRDDQQLWSSLESYLSRYHEVDFTHGICPDCARRLYPDFYP
ncbi:MAG: hypothetical protein HGA96_10770 [Desulfobulbaceae bacterium]|nr:hypothetical protein [Desulfobulbaceae bacterium]